jgi:hypothetical protein
MDEAKHNRPIEYSGISSFAAEVQTMSESMKRIEIEIRHFLYTVKRNLE